MRRRYQFIIFFSIVITIYSLLNVYIFLRGWEVASTIAGFRPWFVALYVVLAFSFLAGRFLERVSISWFSHALVWIGSFWLAAFAYLYLMLLSIDLLRVVNIFVPIFPAWIRMHPTEARQITAAVVLALVVAVLVHGHLNALRPRIRELAIRLSRNGHGLKSLNVVAASDIHLGTIIGKTRLEEIVRRINDLQPDLVLLPGDVFDEDIGPVIRQNLGETLRRIRSRYGVYAITGNHEFIGGVEAAERYLTDHGITVLRDASVCIAGSVHVVGREDLAGRQFGGVGRRPLKDLLASLDRSLPVIVLDHQPFHLEEAVENGIDLQLSGHTHHGQLWPFSWITKRMYEVSWGYKQKGETHFYVSSGVGTWGPPVRTGNTPEIVNVKLTFAS